MYSFDNVHGSDSGSNAGGKIICTDRRVRGYFMEMEKIMRTLKSIKSTQRNRLYFNF